MITAQVQIHGYRKGHQLLASSIVLAKDDQAVVDRLSDVAGPLRPKETFSPYLSTYPLPSGTYYVVAKTWQDLTVPRAGCVRTKSVLIDAQAWSYKPPLVPILHLLGDTELPTEASAVCAELEDEFDVPLPPALDFRASELLEALFLEDAKPVVVFDAPNSELIALRLLMALWPDIRRRFALSTFALSPRKIRGRDFDLVFAPSNAKAKFSDWQGRRVDGRSTQGDRHRWTGTIVHRVFEAPVPRLLSDREVSLLGDRDTDSAATLRIALLWDELLDKLDRTPTAALGLLDIANSGLISSAEAVRSLEPQLAEATLRVADSLPPDAAWDFVGAISRKMQGRNMPVGKTAVKQLATHLAKHAPDGVVALLREPDPSGAISDLVPSIAIGLGNGPAPQVEQVLIAMPADILAHLVSQGGTITSRVAQDDVLIRRMGSVLANVDRELADRAGIMLLPFLVEDRQLSAAIPIIDKLGPQEIAAELRWLGEVNAFQAKQLSATLISRARRVGGLTAVRDALISSDTSARRNQLLEQTIAPTRKDVLWLLDENRLSKTLAVELLVSTLRRANEKELAELLSDQMVGERVIANLPDIAVDLLARATLLNNLPMSTYVRVIRHVIPRVNDAQKFELAQREMERCLRNSFDDDEVWVLPTLFEVLGARLDGAWVARVGLGRARDATVASRNLIAFEKAPSAARTRIVQSVDKIAQALQERRAIDLTEAANDACAKLMFDADKGSREALLDAAGQLIQSLLYARRQPISQMIAALFPVIYRELGKANGMSELLKHVPFFGWDRRKTARRELVDAFMLSSWNPGDLALTACRCGDVTKILERVVTSYGGEEYLWRIESDLARLSENDRGLVLRTIYGLRSDNSYRSDW